MSPREPVSAEQASRNIEAFLEEHRRQLPSAEELSRAVDRERRAGWEPFAAVVLAVLKFRRP